MKNDCIVEAQQWVNAHAYPPKRGRNLRWYCPVKYAVHRTFGADNRQEMINRMEAHLREHYATAWRKRILDGAQSH